MRDIGEEIRQSRPFRSAGQRAVVTLLRTADDLRRLFGEAVRAEGLTLPQYNVLRILRGAGSRGLPTLEIAFRLVERTPGVTRLIDRLEARDLVERRRCEEDRRIVYCSLTPEGRAVVDGLDPAIDRLDASLDGALDPEALEALCESLDLVRARVADLSPDETRT